LQLASGFSQCRPYIIFYRETVKPPCQQSEQADASMLGNEIINYCVI